MKPARLVLICCSLLIGLAFSGNAAVGQSPNYPPYTTWPGSSCRFAGGEPSCPAPVGVQLTMLLVNGLLCTSYSSSFGCESLGTYCSDAIDFGDGATTDVNPGGGSYNVYHTYSAAGTYTITVTEYPCQGDGGSPNTVEYQLSVGSLGSLGQGGLFSGGGSATPALLGVLAGVAALGIGFLGVGGGAEAFLGGDPASLVPRITNPPTYQSDYFPHRTGVFPTYSAVFPNQWNQLFPKYNQVFPTRYDQLFPTYNQVFPLQWNQLFPTYDQIFPTRYDQLFPHYDQLFPKYNQVFPTRYDQLFPTYNQVFPLHYYKIPGSWI